MKIAVAGISPELWESTTDTVETLVVTLHAQLPIQWQQIAALDAQLQDCPAHQAQNAALQAQVTALQTEVQELRAYLTNEEADHVDTNRDPATRAPLRPPAAGGPASGGGLPGYGLCREHRGRAAAGSDTA